MTPSETHDHCVAPTLQLVALSGVPEILPGTDLTTVVLDGMVRSNWQLQHGDCVVLAQKIVSKSEGRFVFLDAVEPSPRAVELAATCSIDAAMVELVLRESVEVIRASPHVLITEHRLGHVMANAGIDQSNVPVVGGRARALLLPVDPDATASRLARTIAERTGVSVSVVINDSFGRPWRLGVCGTALAVYGIPSLVDRRGVPDREARPLEKTFVAMADEVAAAASLVMGQAGESRPIVVVRGLRFEDNACGITPIFRPREHDLFR